MNLLHNPNHRKGNHRNLLEEISANRLSLLEMKNMKVGTLRVAQRNTSRPTLMSIPRELRDSIYALIAADEPTPFQLKGAVRPFHGIRVKSKSKIGLVCSQMYDEYTEVLEQLVKDWFRFHITGDDVWLRIDIWDMKFDTAIEFLGGLSDEEFGRKGAFPVHFILYFNHESDARRSDVIRWLDFCRARRIKARYDVPGPCKRYVYIYDLFEEEGEGPENEEEELIFSCLQRWYSMRGCSNAWLQTVEPWHFHDAVREEGLRAERQGLRRAKTAAEREHTVRQAWP